MESQPEPQATQAARRLHKRLHIAHRPFRPAVAGPTSASTGLKTRAGGRMHGSAATNEAKDTARVLWCSGSLTRQRVGLAQGHGHRGRVELNAESLQHQDRQG